MKKIIFFMIIFFQFTYFTTFAEELLPIDAVLVLDVSRSMATADPDRISRDAMHLFIEKLSENRDRVGIVVYAGNVERSLALQEIQMPKDREILKNFIDGLEYASWTDHGIGLLEAVRMLEQCFFDEDASRQGIIVFLTDGNMNVNPWGERTNETAQEDVHEAIYTARELNIPIHVIGLNFDGNLAWQPIELIAEATNGLAFETANAEDIPEIINAFFHVMIAAPQTRIEEPEPPEEVTVLQEATEEYLPETSVYIEEETEHTEAIYENTNHTKNFLATAVSFVLAVAIAAFLFTKSTKLKRVFTGKIILETQGVPRTLNLIEYGNRVSLGTLLENPALNSVILTPSPTAPSHLPQLKIKCKNHSVKFIKDFIEQEISKGISLTTGAEVLISADDVQVRLKYI
ncbi:MAG: VWA domain-containing protein [Defluviitaleaceae bacterium]|nr:VWA domain-containing protein [Defluviitaleaceae bacterium]